MNTRIAKFCYNRLSIRQRPQQQPTTTSTTTPPPTLVTTRQQHITGPRHHGDCPPDNYSTQPLKLMRKKSRKTTDIKQLSCCYKVLQQLKKGRKGTARTAADNHLENEEIRNLPALSLADRIPKGIRRNPNPSTSPLPTGLQKKHNPGPSGSHCRQDSQKK